MLLHLAADASRIGGRSSLLTAFGTGEGDVVAWGPPEVIGLYGTITMYVNKSCFYHTNVFAMSFGIADYCCSPADLLLHSCCSRIALLLHSCCSPAALLLLSCRSHAAPVVLLLFS